MADAKFKAGDRLTWRSPDGYTEDVEVHAVPDRAGPGGQRYQVVRWVNVGRPGAFYWWVNEQDLRTQEDDR